MDGLPKLDPKNAATLEKLHAASIKRCKTTVIFYEKLKASIALVKSLNKRLKEVKGKELKEDLTFKLGLAKSAEAIQRSSFQVIFKMYSSVSERQAHMAGTIELEHLAQTIPKDVEGFTKFAQMVRKKSESSTAGCQKTQNELRKGVTEQRLINAFYARINFKVWSMKLAKVDKLIEMLNKEKKEKLTKPM